MMAHLPALRRGPRPATLCGEPRPAGRGGGTATVRCSVIKLLRSSVPGTAANEEALSRPQEDDTYLWMRSWGDRLSALYAAGRAPHVSSTARSTHRHPPQHHQ